MNYKTITSKANGPKAPTYNQRVRLIFLAQLKKNGLTLEIAKRNKSRTLHFDRDFYEVNRIIKACKTSILTVEMFAAITGLSTNRIHQALYGRS